MNKRLRHALIASAPVAVTALALIPWMTAHAQVSYVPLTTLPGLFRAGVPTNPVAIIKGIYGLAIGIGSVIATVMIIWAGFEYMYQESITGKSAAKERITNAFLGLLVILGSYILLRTINPALVNFNLTLPGGGGKVANLVAVQTNFNKAQVKIREAQKQADTLRNEIASIDQTIANAKANVAAINAGPQPITEALAKSKAEQEKSLAELEKTRSGKVLDEKYIRMTGGLDMNISAMEESIVNKDSVNNVPANIQRGLDNIASARAALVEAQSKGSDPAIAEKIKRLDVEEIYFRANAAQLNLIYEWQEGRGAKPSEADLLRIQATATTNLTRNGAPDLVKQIEESTARRISVICYSNDPGDTTDLIRDCQSK